MNLSLVNDSPDNSNHIEIGIEKLKYSSSDSYQTKITEINMAYISDLCSTILNPASQPSYPAAVHIPM